MTRLEISYSSLSWCRPKCLTCPTYSTTEMKKLALHHDTQRVRMKECRRRVASSTCQEQLFQATRLLWCQAIIPCKFQANLSRVATGLKLPTAKRSIIATSFGNQSAWATRDRFRWMREWKTTQWDQFSTTIWMATSAFARKMAW